MRWRMPIHLGIRPRIHDFHQATNAVTIDRRAEAHLSFDLVAFGHSHLAHVVAEAGDLGALRVVPGIGGPSPYSNPLLDIFGLPVTNDNLAVQPHPATDVAEL